MTNAELAKELRIAAELAKAENPSALAVHALYNASYRLVVFGVYDALGIMASVKRALLAHRPSVTGCELPIQLAIEVFEKVHGEIVT